MARKTHRTERVEVHEEKDRSSFISLVYGAFTVIALFGLAFFLFRLLPGREDDKAGKDSGKVTEESAKTEDSEDEAKKEDTGKQDSYVVQEGDTLWSIAEKFYKSGYNWVDLAKSNNLENPDVVPTGTKLVIPSAAPKVVTVSQGQVSGVQSGKIEGGTYTVMSGDSLWMIAERAYGDGYKWVQVAKENKLVNPDFIHSGNVLKVPR